LYIKPGVKLQPILPGGGQERGLRYGTENLFAIAGMGEAARIAKDEMGQESERLKGMRDKLIDEISKIEESYLTGHPTQRLQPRKFPVQSYRRGEHPVNMDMYNIQVATGSVCTSRTLEPSHVLLAVGLKHEEAHGSMVMTLGRSNNAEEIPIITKAVKETVQRSRELTPMYNKRGD